MKEYIGFTQPELKEIFITCPKLFMTGKCPHYQIVCNAGLCYRSNWAWSYVHFLLIITDIIYFINTGHFEISARSAITDRINFLRDEMGLTNKDIMAFPMCLRYRLASIIKPRHLFLTHLGKAQYDPVKENYVSLHSLLSGRDVVFCENVAKVPVKQFNDFLKTL